MLHPHGTICFDVHGSYRGSAMFIFSAYHKVDQPLNLYYCLTFDTCLEVSFWSPWSVDDRVEIYFS